MLNTRLRLLLNALLPMSLAACAASSRPDSSAPAMEPKAAPPPVSAAPTPSAASDERAAAAPAALPEMAAKGQAFATAPSTNDAVAELDRAERELDRALGARATAESRSAPSAARDQERKSGAASRPSAAAPAKKAGPVQADDTALGGSANEGAVCSIACKALASMGRAAVHVCELSGGSDPCTRAQGRVDAARARVLTQCGACGGAQ